MASRTESRILRETYNFYRNRLAHISSDEHYLFETPMEEARKALEQLDITVGVRCLTDVFEIVEEHELIDEDLIYPGPPSFHKLAHYLD